MAMVLSIRTSEIVIEAVPVQSRFSGKPPNPDLFLHLKNGIFGKYLVSYILPKIGAPNACSFLKIYASNYHLNTQTFV